MRICQYFITGMWMKSCCSRTKPPAIWSSSGLPYSLIRRAMLCVTRLAPNITSKAGTGKPQIFCSLCFTKLRPAVVMQQTSVSKQRLPCRLPDGFKPPGRFIPKA
ncbi:hypothetical protein D3C75_604740 [compost metagenome]